MALLGLVGLALVAAQPAPVPAKADPLFRDLVRIGRWRGQWQASTAYQPGDVVERGGTVYLVWQAGGPQGLEPVPLVAGETLAFEERFGGAAGPFLPGRKVAAYSWIVTGEGYRSARLGPGYVTASGNTYFVVDGIAPRISEFGSTLTLAKADGLATMALQRGGFGAMWHVNWTARAIGEMTFWDETGAAQTPRPRYEWNSGARMTPGRHTLTVRIRGNLLLGYLDGKPGFLWVDDRIGKLAAPATAVYVQNHAATAGEERQERVWVKLRR